jgi:hypothetical protein
MRQIEFQPEQFEYVRATDETALLRLSGTWRHDTPDPEACALVALRRRRATPLEQLPQLPGADGWRVAFSAPIELVEGRTRFALETPSGKRLPLPRPGERRAAESPAMATV